MRKAALLLILCSQVIATSRALAQNAGATPPNVLFIMVDDLNMDLGTYGHPVVQTPNIDRIAASGMRFDGAVCPSPVCNPSRVSIMTGMRPFTTGIRQNQDAFLTNTIANVPTLPFKFKSDGYFTGGAGKVFHLSYVEPSSWDDYQVSNSGTCNDPWVVVPPHPVPADGWKTVYWGPFENGPDGSLGDMCDTKVTDSTLTMMDPLTEPFFVVAGYVGPHLPLIYPEAYGGLYDPASDVAPLPQGETQGWQDSLHLNTYSSPQYLDPAYDSQPQVGRREATVAYWRTITYVDSEVGRLLDHLESTGLDQNTVVVFLSDHGWSNGLHRSHTKFRLFEASVRVPLLISVPGQSTAGQSCSQPVELIDVYPTLVELCGLTEPAAVEGQSLVPLLADPSTPHKPAAFSCRSGGWPDTPNNDEGVVVHTGQKKFVHWAPFDNHQFYDLSTDPGEYVNLHGDPAHKADVEMHWQLLIDEGLLNCDSFWTTYGTGLAGTLGVPTMTLGSPPLLGQPIEVTITNSLGAPTVALHMLGAAATSIPQWGGTLLVQPVIFKVFNVPADGLSIATSLTDERRHCGRSIYMQVLEVDPGAPQGYSLTPGVHMIPGTS
jgi:arylsulfatase A-like enzyme